MSRGRGSDGQDDVDAEFAAIVADLERDGFGQDSDEETTLDLGRDLGREFDRPQRTQPGTDRGQGQTSGKQSSEQQTPSQQGPGQQGPGQPDGPAQDSGERPEVWRGSSVEWDWANATDAEHYVPPEPPPMPRLRTGTILAIVLLVLGLLLLIVPQLVGIPSRIGTPIALVALATGIGMLVLRMRSGPPPDTGWDDGAQV